MKLIRIGVAASMVVAAAGLAGVGSANASDVCTTNRVCLYGNNDFKWKFSQRLPGYGIVNFSGTHNNEMDSWRNLTNRNAAGYDLGNGRGDCQTFKAGYSDNNVNFTNSDEVSSLRTNGGC